MPEFRSSLNYLGHSIRIPNLIPRQSAWLRHGPFADWLVRAAQPRRIVELGTHYGYSYFVMCEAVRDEKLNTDCFAIDTWQGDEHAGVYGGEVYDWVGEANHEFADFSTLLRKTFAEALSDITDGSVDLLHIDGRHFYEDVKEDFESWIPKLSTRAIVIFHDTKVRERNFGVYRYWEELRQNYAGFNFDYEHGLGVLFFGNSFSDEISSLKAQVETPEGLEFVQGLFETAGDIYVANAQLKIMHSDLKDLSSERPFRPLPHDIESLSNEVRGALSLRDIYWENILNERDRNFQFRLGDQSAVITAQSRALFANISLIEALQIEISELNRRLDAKIQHVNQLIEAVHLAQRLLVRPFSTSLRRNLAKFILNTMPMLSAENRRKLKRSIWKRDPHRISAEFYLHDDMQENKIQDSESKS